MPALQPDLLHLLMRFCGASASKLSGRRPTPAELHALALGYEEQVVAQRVYVLVVEGHHAEDTVAVGPGERCEVAHDRGLGGHPPAVGEPPGRDHALLQVPREGPLVGLHPGEILRVVHQPWGRRQVGPALRDNHSLRGVEPDERDRRAPEVLYHPERNVASAPRIPDRLGEAGPGETHVSGLPRMWLAHGPQSAATTAYATDLFHDARILQPTPQWRSRPRKRRGMRPALPSWTLLSAATDGSEPASRSASAAR